MTNLTVASLTPFRGWPFGWAAFDTWSPLSLNDGHPVWDETDDSVSVSFTVPGFKRDEISVEHNNGLLAVRAKNAKQSLNQSVSLDRGLDIGKAEARLENGVLTISMPKTSESRPKRIEIRD